MVKNQHSFMNVQENKENVEWIKESDVDHGRRMLKSLKQNLARLMEYHSIHNKCQQSLNFAVIEQTGYLQAWCCQCNCNEIVI